MTKTLAALMLLLLLYSNLLARPVVDAPRVFMLNARQLAETRQRIHDGDKSLDAALARLESDAHQALSQEPPSVVSKETTPPSGDKHDYMSQAPYFWPDP